MIDKEKIKESSWKYNISESLEGEIARRAYMDGAHWAIQEFLKDLWHDIKEEPRKGKWIVTRYLNDGNDYVYEVDLNTSIMSWEEYTRKYRITQWLYIDDLLPKDRD